MNIHHARRPLRLMGVLALAVLLALSSLFPSSFVQGATAVRGTPFAGTTVFLINHTGDPIIGGLDKQQYGAIGNFSTTQYVRLNFRNIGSSSSEAAVLRSTVQNLINQYPSSAYLFTFAGHGNTTGRGVDGLNSSRGQLAATTWKTLEANGIQNAAVVFDDCGSGNVCLNKYGSAFQDLQSLPELLTSTNPNTTGIAPDFGQRISSALRNFDVADVNKDRVLTLGELADYVYGKTKAGYWRKGKYLGDRDTPLFFKDAETALKYAGAGNLDAFCAYLQGDEAGGETGDKYKQNSMIRYTIAWRLDTANAGNEEKSAFWRGAYGKNYIPEDDVVKTAKKIMSEQSHALEQGSRYSVPLDKIKFINLKAGAEDERCNCKDLFTGGDKIPTVGPVRKGDVCPGQTGLTPQSAAGPSSGQPNSGQIPPPGSGGGGGAPPGGDLGSLLGPLGNLLSQLGRGGGGQPSGGGGQPSSGSGQQQPESSPRPTEEGFPADTDRDRDRVDLSQVLRDIARSGLPDSLVEQIVKIVLTVILQLVRGGTSGGTTTIGETGVP